MEFHRRLLVRAPFLFIAAVFPAAMSEVSVAQPLLGQDTTRFNFTGKFAGWKNNVGLFPAPEISPLENATMSGFFIFQHGTRDLRPEDSEIGIYQGITVMQMNITTPDKRHYTYSNTGGQITVMNNGNYKVQTNGVPGDLYSVVSGSAFKTISGPVISFAAAAGGWQPYGLALEVGAPNFIGNDSLSKSPPGLTSFSDGQPHVESATLSFWDGAIHNNRREMNMQLTSFTVAPVPESPALVGLAMGLAALLIRLRRLSS